MNIKIIASIVISFIILASFCVQQLAPGYPTYFPKIQYNFSNNVIDSAKIQLGRQLFYDPILSADNTISCASCHSPYNAFAHTDHNVSHGINDELGTRNAPALFNLAWQNTFMWDGSVNHLDVQALAPISHPKEMGSSISSVVAILKTSSFYRNLFYKAYNDSAITGEKVLKSLAQFQLSLISANAKYDQVKLGKATFTTQEANGYNLFLKNCNTCHTEPLFSNYQFTNNGLAVDTTLSDYGRWMVTKKSEDSLLFKTPSLRNLSYTYPYMHDGRFKKLQEVINHYTNNIQPSNTLSQVLKKSMALTPNDKVDLIAFLLTLNDKDFVFNPEHQFPRK